MNEQNNSIPSAAIVGRPNVGKSSLFNAFLKRRAAIVHSQSGVTRDRIAAVCEFRGKKFQLFDTGGLSLYEGESTSKAEWAGEIKKQVEAAIESAKKIIFVVEAGNLTPLDVDIASKLRVSGKEIFLAINKSDNDAAISKSAIFAKLGFEKVFHVSCVHNAGISELAASVTSDFPEWKEDSLPPLKIAVVGRPNVGKSSLVNSFLREERVIVSHLPGTTRDAVECRKRIEIGGETIDVTFVDTAGLRQKRKADTPVEFFSIDRTEKAIKASDVLILVLEGFIDGASAQDRKIANLARESGRGVIIAVNKWDLCKGISKHECTMRIRATLPFLNYAPIVMTSSKNGDGINSLFSALLELRSTLAFKPPTPIVNRVLEEAFNVCPPPFSGRSSFKVYYATYLGGVPPQFLLFCNNSTLCPAHYLKYLENCLRKKFVFAGYPLSFQLRARKK
jgi:GTP-binding protein